MDLSGLLDMLNQPQADWQTILGPPQTWDYNPLYSLLLGGLAANAPKKAIPESPLEGGPVMISGGGGPGKAATPAEFGANVQQIANSLRPDLGNRVTIGNVYDAYGKTFPDAGSMNSFKERLVDAGKKRFLELSRSDMPERFPGGREERLRSEAKWNADTVHFIRQK